MTFDPSLIDGMFSEPVDLSDYRLVLGLQHRPGAGLRVCAWDGENVRHMSPAAARRLAKSLDGEALKPVADALEALADRVGEIEASVAAARLNPLSEMAAEGNA